MDTASIEIVPATSAADMAVFHGTMRRIFPTDEDSWSLAAIVERQAKQRGSTLPVEYSLIRIDGEIAGMRWLSLDLERHVAYCPYGGLLPEHQRRGLYPQILTRYEAYLQRAFQIAMLLNDCQNPLKQTDGKVAADRLRFFQKKVGYVFIDDGNYPYIRPYPDLSVPERKSYDYLLGFKLLDRNHRNHQNHRNQEMCERIARHAGSLPLSIYRWLYMALMRLDTGIADEAALRDKYPAIAEFLARVDSGLMQTPEPSVSLLCPA